MSNLDRLWIFCLVYLDDVIIFSKSEEEHLKHLNYVLKLIGEAGFLLKPQKCQLFKKKLKFLGHVVSEHGVQPDPDKVKAIMAVQPPKNVKELQKVLGLFGYYRRFVKKFSEKVAPSLICLRKR